MIISSQLIAGAPILTQTPQDGDSVITMPPLVVKTLELPYPTYAQQAFTATANENSIGRAVGIGQQVNAGSSTLDLVACAKGVWDLWVCGVLDNTAFTAYNAQTVTISCLSLDGTRAIASLGIFSTNADSGGRNGIIELRRIISAVESFRVQALLTVAGVSTLNAQITCHANRLL